MPRTLSTAAVIQPHRARGRSLGVPTINVPAPLDIADGVYAGFVKHQGLTFPAAIFVGAAITFGETERQVEAHILDADIDLQGGVVIICQQFIRPNQKFADAAALQTQMQQDIIAIKQCLQASSKNS